MKKVFLLLLLSLTIAPAFAKDLSVEKIIKKTNEAAYYQGEDGRAQVTMTITDNQGRKRVREFVILRKDLKDENQFFYVYFNRPADVKKMVFLVWKHINKDDDRWLYLPALDLVKRISASDERTSFVGSDFFYEDVSGRGTEEDHHTLKEITETYYVLTNTPKEPTIVEFSSYTMWIHKETFLPVKIEYFQNEKLYRVYEALKVEMIQGFPTVTQSRMKDLRAGNETLLDYNNVTYNLGIPDTIFSERYLRQPPREYLR